MNAFQWPLALTENSPDEYAYSNLQIAHALQNAEQSILKIVCRETSELHPIIPLFDAWNQRPQTIGNSFADSCFSYDLLPGDRSLAMTAAVGLSAQLKQRLHIQPMSLDSILPVLRVLCDLVVLRVYLCREPVDDGQIYNLACIRGNQTNGLDMTFKTGIYTQAHTGYLQRHLSLPEQALAASQGSTNTRLPPVSISSHGSSGARLKVNPNLEIPLFLQGSQSHTAHMSDGSRYKWLNNVQLDIYSMEDVFQPTEHLPSTPVAQISTRVHNPPSVVPKRPLATMNVSPVPQQVQSPNVPENTYNLRKNPPKTVKAEAASAPKRAMTDTFNGPNKKRRQSKAEQKAESEYEEKNDQSNSEDSDVEMEVIEPRTKGPTRGQGRGRGRGMKSVRRHSSKKQ